MALSRNCRHNSRTGTREIGHSRRLYASHLHEGMHYTGRKIVSADMESCLQALLVRNIQNTAAIALRLALQVPDVCNHNQEQAADPLF